MPQNYDLSTIFGEITKTLVANQQALNDADKTNHNHGDNMVKTFRTARRAVASDKSKTPAQQLEYVAERLNKTATSGSGHIYAQGFERATKNFEGKPVNPDTIGTLIEALMGSDTLKQPQQQQAQLSQGGGGDLLTTLLGGLMGGEHQQPQQTQPKPQQGQAGSDMLTTLLGGLMDGGSSSQQSQPAPDDLIGTLLGGLSGGSTQSKPQSGMNAGDLLSAALRYHAAKKKGRSTVEAIMSALSKSSPLGGTPERTQSGALVIQTLMNLLGKAK
jgi:hypothetical protein